MLLITLTSVLLAVLGWRRATTAARGWNRTISSLEMAGDIIEAHQKCIDGLHHITAEALTLAAEAGLASEASALMDRVRLNAYESSYDLYEAIGHEADASAPEAAEAGPLAFLRRARERGGR
jgi:hypothetical protein